MRGYFFLIYFIVFQSFAKVMVPKDLTFAGMRLELAPAVRDRIQSDVDNLMRNEKYFQMKIDRSSMFFPIIERVFKEESLPEDFKYLVMQESGLVADAVSTSNAVGFWQFKKETAIEVGMRVDNQVDERMNIVSSSRGAARYLKKHQGILNNWVYALMSYNTGLGGARPHIKDKNLGSSSMKIDQDVHWYVLKFLAHKIAYESADYSKANPPYQLAEMTNASQMSISDIATSSGCEKRLVAEYNKWLLASKVPSDKVYTVLVPFEYKSHKPLALSEVIHQPGQIGTGKKENVELNGAGGTLIPLNWNGKKAVIARNGADFSILAKAGSIDLKQFLDYNDLNRGDRPVPGQVYYLERKGKKGKIAFHVLQPGETVWQVAQNHGIRYKDLLKMNRIEKSAHVRTGSKLWLTKSLPKGAALEVVPILDSPLPVKETVQEVPVEEKTVSDTVQVKVQDIYEKPVLEVVRLNEFHKVIKGEGLYGISRLHGTTVDSIMKWNSLSETHINEGQILRVKPLEPGEEADDEFIVHVVKSGETLYKLSRLYEIPVQAILSINGKTTDHIREGEILKITKK